MTEFRLPRPQNVDLVFDGDLLSEKSSAAPGAPRWLETRIYLTASGKYVTEMVGRSTLPGEQDKITVNVYDRPGDVRLGFLRTRTTGPQRGEQYLTVQAEDTIHEASKHDGSLTAALVERI